MGAKWSGKEADARCPSGQAWLPALAWPHHCHQSLFLFLKLIFSVLWFLKLAMLFTYRHRVVNEAGVDINLLLYGHNLIISADLHQ